MRHGSSCWLRLLLGLSLVPAAPWAVRQGSGLSWRIRPVRVSTGARWPAPVTLCTLCRGATPNPPGANSGFGAMTLAQSMWVTLSEQSGQCIRCGALTWDRWRFHLWPRVPPSAFCATAFPP